MMLGWMVYVGVVVALMTVFSAAAYAGLLRAGGEDAGGTSAVFD